MFNQLNLRDVCELYEEYIRATYAVLKGQRLLNEFYSVLYRVVLQQWGFQRQFPVQKMKQAETQLARKHLATLSVQRLLAARTALQAGFASLGTSPASRNTYRSRFEGFLQWAEQEPWWPSARLARVQNECCPPMANPHGAASTLALTERTGKYKRYALKWQEMPETLQQELDQFSEFLTAKTYAGRRIDPVCDATARVYLQDVCLWLGYLHRYAQPAIPLDQLSLASLFPLISEDDLERLTVRKRRKRWKKVKLALEELIGQFFEFQSQFNQATSPRTRRNKLCALLAVAKFKYIAEVERKNDYQHIPLFTVLYQQFDTVAKEVRLWEKNRKTVVDQEQKWPDVVEGKTALTVLRETVLEPLRLECRPRQKRGTWRGGKAIATSQQKHLEWSDMLDQPARRQEEPKTRKVATACPIKRPDDVPPDGWYIPLPPDEYRDKDPLTGLVSDNYLYRTYTHKKKTYPEGVYVLDTQGYKTDKSYGPQSILIQNRSFDDGTCLYDYLDRYLCGWWLPGGYKTQPLYDWWEPTLRGRRGRWVTAGRLEFTPFDACCLPRTAKAPLWTWGYVFPMVKTGMLASGSSYAGSFEADAHRLIGKRTSPHTLRYIWATWGFQMGLTDRQLEALAYAMGHTVETLRKMYDRCSPEEKRRPIEELIEALLFAESPGSKDAHQAHLSALIQSAQRLSRPEQQRLIEALTA